jgi:muconate cycloisomerase
MRIVELAAFHVRIPLKKRIRHASFARDENDTLLVRCRLDTGQVGWGEGLPRPYVTGESIATAWEQVRQTTWPEQLGDTFDDLKGAVALADRITLAPPANGIPTAFVHRGSFGNSVRCAVELAILEAAARAGDVPLSTVTTLVPETAGIRQSRDAVQYSAVLTSETPFKQWLSAWKYRLYGFAQVKVKVGAADVDDAALLARTRKILGPKVELRVDANEAWSCATLVEKMAPLRAFDIRSIEQPVPHAESDGLATVRAALGIPLMLDESLCSLSDAQRAIELGTCDLFNLRLSKCGGFLRTLRIAALAHRAGLGYQLGCQVGETGILSAAGRHFATSVGEIRNLEGSYDRHLVRERLTREDITFGKGGRASRLTGPGLGVTVDEAAVHRVTLAEARWPIGL